MRVCLRVIAAVMTISGFPGGLDRPTLFGACSPLHFLATPNCRAMQRSLNVARWHGAWIIVVSSVGLPVKRVQSSELTRYI